MSLKPTEYTRDDAAKDAREMWSIQESDWAEFPFEMQLSLMLDAVIINYSRAVINRVGG